MLPRSRTVNLHAASKPFGKNVVHCSYLMIITPANELGPQVFEKIAFFDHHLGGIWEINSSSILQVARVVLMLRSGWCLTNTLGFIQMLLSMNFYANNTHSDAH
jgi:hypothetical protein